MEELKLIIRVFQLIAKMDSRFRGNDIIPNLSFPRKTYKVEKKVYFVDNILSIVNVRLRQSH